MAPLSYHWQHQSMTFAAVITETKWKKGKLTDNVNLNRSIDHSLVVTWCNASVLATISLLHSDKVQSAVGILRPFWNRGMAILVPPDPRWNTPFCTAPKRRIGTKFQFHAYWNRTELQLFWNRTKISDSVMLPETHHYFWPNGKYTCMYTCMHTYKNVCVLCKHWCKYAYHVRVYVRMSLCV